MFYADHPCIFREEDRAISYLVKLGSDSRGKYPGETLELSCEPKLWTSYCPHCSTQVSCQYEYNAYGSSYEMLWHLSEEQQYYCTGVCFTQDGWKGSIMGGERDRSLFMCLYFGPANGAAICGAPGHEPQHGIACILCSDLSRQSAER